MRSHHYCVKDQSEGRSGMTGSKKILISSMKQSGNAYLPVLNKMVTFDSFVSGCISNDKYIAHCKPDPKDLLLYAPNDHSTYVVMIGPEGDFCDEELVIAGNNSFRSVSLGKNTLRTETAGIVTCQIICDRHNLKFC